MKTASFAIDIKEQTPASRQLTSAVQRASETLREEVLRARYLRKDAQGCITESPEELWRRVAQTVAQAEMKYGGDDARKRYEEQFYRLMEQGVFLPNSPTLFGAGRKNQMLSACFVLPVPDSLDGILQTGKDAGVTQKEGGGVGFDFSQLRPRGAPVRSTAGVASGPVSFIEALNALAQVIKQGGLRRAANMAVLRVDHPDIEAFITCKRNGCDLDAFNLSVGIPDTFMEALGRGESYPIIDPRTGVECERRDAATMWGLICESAWNCGDPGVIFLDTINAANPTPQLGAIAATNPCGEQPLLPYESCNLGSINLSWMVRNGSVDWDRLRETVSVGVRFLDDVIDVNHFPLRQIEETTKGNRKIGLGIMGLAHMLVLLRIAYDSQEAIEVAGEVMRCIGEQALAASRQLAKERGAFPNFEKSVYPRRGEPAVRNATRTTVAPTGTISIIADTSSGIEPIMAVAYTRRALDREFLVIDPLFEEMSQGRGLLSDRLLGEVVRTGSVQDVPEVPEDLKALFKTACEIPLEQHVKMQAAVQRYTDNAVSKTVNLAPDATVDDVNRVFLLAHKLRCKGITVFRQGCRAAVMGSGVNVRPYTQMRNRPKVTLGRSEKSKTGCGSLYVHVAHDERGLLEVFSNLGKGGGCPAQSEATARLTSLCLRSDVNPREIIRQLSGIRCPTACSRHAQGSPVDVLSCPDAIAKAVGTIVGDREKAIAGGRSLAACPACGGPREPGRCGICLSCWAGGCQPA